MIKLSIDHLFYFSLCNKNRRTTKIRKRGNTYTYTVDVGIDPLTGKRNQITKGGFKRKRDTEAAARKIVIELEENRFIKWSSKILSSFVND